MKKALIIFSFFFLANIACTVSDPEMVELLQEIKAQNDKIMQEVESMKSQLSLLEGKYQTILESIADNKKEVEALKSQIEGLKTQISQQLIKIEQLSAQLTKQGADILKLSAEITQLKASCEELIIKFNNVLNNGPSGVDNSGNLPNEGSIQDIDGNVYRTVKIGNQIWMAENLKTTKLNDGTPIVFGNLDMYWNGVYTIKDPVYAWYNNNINNKELYGGLYNWYTVNTNKLCPSGWHVPNDAEWVELENFLGGRQVAGGKLKQAGTSYWQIPNWGATNETGFNSLPSGMRVESTFTSIGAYAQYWTSTAYGDNPPGAVYRQTTSTGENLERNINFKVYGNSVRCIKN